MDNDKDLTATVACKVKKGKAEHCDNISSAIYGMGFIGAAIYFIQHAGTIWAGLFGVIKAIFWPVILVYKLLELLKM